MRRVFWQGLKILVFIISLVPVSLLLYDAFTDQLGANPIETLHFRLGDWALRFLCLGLAITPIKKMTGIKELVRFKRLLGLYAFFYASLHFLVYICLDLSFSMDQLMDEIPKSPYIIVGLITYSLLIPLALTSTKKMQKRLGQKWRRLHRLVYLIAILAVVHYLWLTKIDITEPLIYMGVIGVLLGFRMIKFRGLQ
ncbi:MAG: sulfoxide reductase heme-binding subunit YedZ [Methylococcales bacterium]|nr:sulfoxide reductase heme-binding subunit YedZ [Methylococcales bacterium]